MTRSRSNRGGQRDLLPHWCLRRGLPATPGPLPRAAGRPSEGECSRGWAAGTAIVPGEVQILSKTKRGEAVDRKI